MCRIDDGDRSEVHSEATVTARKEHRCEECRRAIQPGERYLRVFSIFEGNANCMKICAHCQVAQAWLMANCDGYIYGEVAEEIIEHAQEYPRLAWPLYRVAAGMRRKWRTRKGAMMPPPKLPPAIATILSPSPSPQERT